MHVICGFGQILDPKKKLCGSSVTAARRFKDTMGISTPS